MCTSFLFSRSHMLKVVLFSLRYKTPVFLFISLRGKSFRLSRLTSLHFQHEVAFPLDASGSNDTEI